MHRRILHRLSFFQPFMCHIGRRRISPSRYDGPDMAKDKTRDLTSDVVFVKLSSPRIFLVRMVVFLILCALVVVVLYRQIWTAFLANPGLNALILGVLLIGIALAFRQVIRLFPEINWVNGFRLADPGLAVERSPSLLAPMSVLL